jgi:hypothetical protein
MNTHWQKTHSHCRRCVACCAIGMACIGCLAAHARAENRNTTEIEPHHLLDGRERLVLSLQKTLATGEVRSMHVVDTSADNNANNTGNKFSSTTDQAESTSTRTPELDPLAAERALERTLTQSGALLLPSGQAELQFGVSYARMQQQSIVEVPDGPSTFALLDLRRNEYGANLSGRLGLPFDAQAELTIPYRLVTQSMVTSDGQTATHVRHNTAAVIGDVSVGLAKTLMHDHGNWPDMIGRLTWNSGSGSEASNGLAIGDGFKKIRAELTLLKRDDPLVFTGTMTVESTLKKNAVKPGNQFGVSLSALLATSPDTSLSVGFDQAFSTQTRVHGVRIAGSDQVSGLLTFGATSIIGKRTLLSVSVGKGLTKGAPAYVVNVALPFRFDLLK